MVSTRKALAAFTATGLGALAYAHLETRRFTLRRIEIPILPPGQNSLRLLHISDLHMIPGQGAKLRWVQSLAALSPDAVVATGDFLSHVEGVSSALEALDPLMELPGALSWGAMTITHRSPLTP